MASKNPIVSRAVTEYAQACKHPERAAILAAAKANLATARIHDFIERTLADTPPLTTEQRQRLTHLLTVEGGEGK